MRNILLKYIRFSEAGIFHSAILSFFVKLAAAGLTFTFNIVLVRQLGAENAGLYFIALSVILVGSIIGRVGIDNALLRFVAAYASLDDWISAKNIYYTGILVTTLASGFTTLVVWFSSDLLAIRLFMKPEIGIYLKQMSFAILPLSLLIVHAETLKSVKKVFFSQIVQGASTPLLSLIFLSVAGASLGVFGPIYSYLFGIYASFFLSLYLWRISTPKIKFRDISLNVRGLLKNSIPLFWVASTGLINESISTFILGIYASPSDVAVFNAALRSAMLISFILVAVNSVVAPKFAIYHSQGKLDQLEALAKNSTLLMSIAAFPILVIFISLSEWIMNLYGPGFESGANAFRILAAGQFINVATGSVGYLLIMTGNEKSLRNNALLSTAIVIVLNLLMVPAHGLAGAVFATSISVIVVNMISVILVYKKLGFYPISFKLIRTKK